MEAASVFETLLSIPLYMAP